jgi:alkanesulfonate monooxygenase SsuD/methylene tetrahydromethanopterin reductase-like flavin-dependent oxidoreductase (luciferase family)
MRLGIVLDVAAGEAPLGSLVEQAVAAEEHGLELAWLEAGPATGPPLITAAALGARTTVLRLAACVAAGEHPLAIAEAAAVADNCSNGRLVLAVASDDAALLMETADALLAATAAGPFRHAGERWTIPAHRPENDGAQERIVVTPATVQLELPLWLAGAAAPAVARSRGLASVAGTTDGDPAKEWRTTEDQLGPAAARLGRPGIYTPAVGPDGAFDDGELVELLRADQQAWGLDLAVVRLPSSLGAVARVRAIQRLASWVKPRVIQVPLPDGLEDDWSAHLAQRLDELGPK